MKKPIAPPKASADRLPPTSWKGRRRCLKAASLLGLAAVVALSSCATNPTRAGMVGGGDPNHPAVKARAAQIAQEAPGDYWVGRRWWTEGTRFWGYVRRPRQPWSQAKLVMMNESVKHSPDRLPEEAESGPSHGFDHNYEYRLWGRFSSREVYVPNSNLMLPEFILQNYELINATPGFVFQPGERYNPKRLPPKFPPIPR